MPMMQPDELAAKRRIAAALIQSNQIKVDYVDDDDSQAMKDLHKMVNAVYKALTKAG